MIDIPNYPADVSVAKPMVSVQVGGLIYEALSWSIDGEVEAGLPSAVVGGTGITASTGTLVFPPVSEVGGSRVSPWSAGVWPPRRGDKVIVRAGYGDAMCEVFTGIVSGTSGGTGSNLSVTIRDDIDRIRRRVTFDPQMATSPRIDWTTDTNFISRGLSSSFFMSQAAQICGYHTVPDRSGDEWSVFYASMNGAIIPTRGTVKTSSIQQPTPYIRWPLWKNAPWGQGTYNMLATILPAPWAPGASRITTSRPLRLSFIRGVQGTLGASLTAHWGDMSVQLAYNHHAGTAYLQLSTASSSWRSAEVRCHQDTVVVGSFNHGGAYELRNNMGDVASGVLSWSSRFADQDMSLITVSVPEDGTQIAGAQVYLVDDWSPLLFKRNFLMDNTSSVGTLIGTRAIDSTALELIREICAAELSGAWIDSRGRLVMKNRETLVSQAPVATKTAMGDIFEYDWEINENSLRHKVFVKGQRVHEGRSSKPTITVWQGSGDTLEAGEPQVTFIEPGGDEEWIAVQPDIWDHVSGTAQGVFPTQFNKGVYSWAIGSAGEAFDEHYKDTGTTIEKMGPRQWVIKSTPPGEVTQKVPVTPNNAPAVLPRWHGESGPIVRSKGRIQFEEFTAQASILGPVWAEDYTHDGGQWIQTEGNAERAGDFIAKYTSVPLVTIHGVRIVPDPRLERGDVIFLRDDQVYSRLIRGIIVGIHHSGTAEKWSMELDMQVISVSSLGDTYEDQRLAWLGQTYNQQATYWATGQPVNTYDAQSTRSTAR